MKGNSERVPGKNLRHLHGKPLFAHILSALLECGLITQVYVDTDSEEISSSVQSMFPTVHIIERPLHLRGDFVPMNDVLAHDVPHMQGQWILQTHATNPLLTSETIGRALELIGASRGRHDSLMSVTRLQTRLWWGPDRPVNHDPRTLQRTQDLDPIFEENSNLYVFDRTCIETNGSRIGGTPVFFEIDQLEGWDIDTESDFRVAEALMARRDS